ncbi:TRAM domain-containing protein [Haloarcula marismortui]|jgi:predicted RNA-binding protein with TRAM domain|uniref:TRAM domain-containing protein n=1 Tax=Haloarcula marismortui ATCC 33799 TaxID=662475 RepID=M0KRU5_9EURY|nr:TRAM domain-containing protein [Haloarcula californiae]EMA23961.1 hypothetical protein C435_03543 [Haloarcula californiae ATCC 33799]
MMRVDDSLISMFHSTLTTGSDTDESLVEIPDSEIETGPLSEGETYRIAILGPIEDGNNSVTDTPSSELSSPTATTSGSENCQYPVSEGQKVTLEIEDMGDEGDGIAKVNGYAVIVPDATVGEEVTVRISNTRSSHAFAEPVPTSDI